MTSDKNHFSELSETVDDSSVDNEELNPPLFDATQVAGEIMAGFDSVNDHVEPHAVSEEVDGDLSDAYKAAFAETETDEWNVDKWILRTLPEVLITITESIAYPSSWLKPGTGKSAFIPYTANSAERRNITADLIEVVALLKGWGVVLNNYVPYTPAEDVSEQELGQIVTETWDGKGRDAFCRIPNILNTPHIAEEELGTFKKWVALCGEKLYNLGDRGHCIPSQWENLAGEKVSTGTDFSATYHDVEALARLQEVGDSWNGELKTVGEQLANFTETENFDNLTALFRWIGVNLEVLWD